MCTFKSWTTALLLGGLLYSSPLMAGGIFTGPVSTYFLTDSVNNTIYGVQGTSVVENFPMVYGTSSQELPIAISNSTIRTTGHDPGLQGGQYTMNGTPTGPVFANLALGHLGDGTSDGTRNYYVPWTTAGSDAVYATDLNWQNPRILFNLPAGGYEGITYDHDNNSIWVSGYGNNLLADYSLSGTLLFAFNTQTPMMSALSYDPEDHTLWFTLYGSNLLEQYSTTGVHLQEGVPTGLPNNPFAGGEQAVPEPGSLSLIGLGAVLVCCGRLRRHARQ